MNTTTYPNRSFSAEKLQFVSEVLKTISHPTRLQIVDMLSMQERMSVTMLQEGLDVEQSLLSHHLSKMKENGVLGAEKEGRTVFYTLKLNEITKILDCMENCEIR